MLVAVGCALGSLLVARLPSSVVVIVSGFVIIRLALFGVGCAVVGVLSVMIRGSGSRWAWAVGMAEFV